jgi:hypothetical protein
MAAAVPIAIVAVDPNPHRGVAAENLSGSRSGRKDGRRSGKRYCKFSHGILIGFPIPRLKQKRPETDIVLLTRVRVPGIDVINVATTFIDA